MTDGLTCIELSLDDLPPKLIIQPWIIKDLKLNAPLCNLIPTNESSCISIIYSVVDAF